MHSLITALFGFGLLLGALYGVAHVDLDEVLGLLPRESPTLTSAIKPKAECPCKAAKERCINDAGTKIFAGECRHLWHGCKQKMYGHPGGLYKSWKACTLAKKKCNDSKDGWCSSLWAKCDEEVKAHSKGGDAKDCYFDKECHVLVNWDRIGELKRGIIGRMKIAHGDEVKMKNLMEHAHQLFKEAGMPEDRIDYILEKWAKFAAEEKSSLWPQACKLSKERCWQNGEKVLEGRCGFLWKRCGEEMEPDSEKSVDTKDCYFDKECHKLVDWEKIGHMKDGILARMKLARGDESKMKDLMARCHQLFAEAGMPDDRIDYILEKWAKYVAEAPNSEEMEPDSEKSVDTKDCYFDKECHKLVDWEKIGQMKDGILARMKLARGDQSKMKDLMLRAHQLFREAGMPDDRIDYILEKWAKYVATGPKEHFHFPCKKARILCFKHGSKSFEGKCRGLWEKCGEDVKGRAKQLEDKKDCYFDAECHKLVDWKKIGDMKAGIFERMKIMRDDAWKMKELKVHVHKLFLEAGMPEDRIDYILDKWAKNAAQEPKDSKVDTKDCYFDQECSKLVDWSKISEKKEDIFSHLKAANGDREKMREWRAQTHQIFKGAGMPEGRIDQILGKWVKSVEENSKGAKDGYKFDGKHGYKFCKLAKIMCEKNGRKEKDDRCGLIWKKCDVESGKKKADTEDCFFDDECNKLVDWEKIEAAKEGIMARMKQMQHDEVTMKEILERARDRFRKAGMPGDRIDYILQKWVRKATSKP